MRNSPQCGPWRLAFAFLVILLLPGNASDALAQRNRKKQQLATIQGVIQNDTRKEFRVSYDEIKTSLRKVVVPKPVPFPASWEKMVEADRRQWLTKFYQSDKGKAFLKNREKELNDAPSFDVKYNSKGDFTVYDVPPGDYGLQGRIDKEINGIKYGFEVFARIKVLKDVDQIKLQPIPVSITPFFQNGQPAPPLSVQTTKGEELRFDLDAYKDHYLFLNFLNTGDLTPGYQKQVQEMYQALGKTHKVKLISIVIDKDKTKAIKWLIKKGFTKGSYGFTGGWEHDSVEGWGVRSTPSGWLISNDAERKILISQHEFFRLARVKSSITEIVRDRLEGKDTPTLANPEAEDTPAKKKADDNDQ